MVYITDILQKPVVTEKTVAQKEKFTFRVHRDATKQEIKRAIKEFYGIIPLKINIISLPQKTKQVRRGVTARKRAPYKKATVTVEKGKTIDFNAFK